MKQDFSNKEHLKVDSLNINHQKWDELIALLEYPAKYSEAQKNELLADEEVRSLYQQMVETREALDFKKSDEEMKMPNVSEEWKRLVSEKSKAEVHTEKENTAKKVSLWNSTLWTPMRKVAAIAAILVISGITFAAIHLATRSFQGAKGDGTEIVASTKDSTQQATALAPAKSEAKTDSATQTKLPLVYENMELQDILKPIAEHFHLQVNYKNESSRHVRLFIQLQENMSLDDILELMNHFEKVNVSREGGMLIVE